MDKFIPIGILLGVTIIGFVPKFLKLGNISRRYDFTVEYRSKFIDFLRELFEKRSFNQQLYYELTKKVNEMQSELGTDGKYVYVEDKLKKYSTSNYQVLLNFLPETCNVLNEFNTEFMIKRYIQEAQICDYMFVRHLGSLELDEKNIRKHIFNPLADFAEGIKLIVSLSVLLLNQFGFISAESSIKIKNNLILKIVNFIVTIVGFVSGIMAIVMGWNTFWELIKSFIK